MRCVGNKIIIFKCCSTLITHLNTASQPDHQPPGEFPLNLLLTIHSSLPPFPLNPPPYNSVACFTDVVQTCTCQRWWEVTVSAQRCSPLLWLVQPAVVSEELPHICVQSPSITDLGMLVNAGSSSDPELCPGSRG